MDSNPCDIVVDRKIGHLYIYIIMHYEHSNVTTLTQVLQHNPKYHNIRHKTNPVLNYLSCASGRQVRLDSHKLYISFGYYLTITSKRLQSLV